MDWQRLRRRLASRTFASVVGFTIVLTAAFVGLAALSFGDADGVRGRIPYFVLATAVAFVTALWRLDDREADGVPVLVGAAGIAIATGTLFGLAVEGVFMTARHPEQIVSSQLVVYFLAAALICTGLGIWGLRHWREFTAVERAEPAGRT